MLVNKKTFLRTFKVNYKVSDPDLNRAYVVPFLYLRH